MGTSISSVTSKYPELGFYGLPGHSNSPADIIKQAQDAEHLGIGNIMISERADFKEISALCGAVSATTKDIFIGTSGTNLNTRHPLITASMGSTLCTLSKGRFALGLAKGVGLRWRSLNLPFPTFEHESVFIELMRSLWKGESIQNHSSLLGEFASISLGHHVEVDVPVLYIGFGENSLRHAGTIYDGAHLHTFMTNQALNNAVGFFREGESTANRPPGKVWSVFATACDPTEREYLKKIVARLATYLQIPGYGDALVACNGWDPDLLAKFRASKPVSGMRGAIDTVATWSELEAIEKLIPETWRPAAVGDAKTCAIKWVEQFQSGADGLIIHASTPEEFEPVLKEYEKIRPTELFARYTNNPGAENVPN